MPACYSYHCLSVMGHILHSTGLSSYTFILLALCAAVRVGSLDAGGVSIGCLPEGPCLTAYTSAEYLTWYQAKQQCRDHNQSLVSMTPELDRLVFSFFLRRGLMENGTWKNIWLGGHVAGEQGTWKWGNGRESKIQFESKEHCAYITKGRIYATQGCGVKLRFLCSNFKSEEKANWFEANAFCRLRGTHLFHPNPILVSPEGHLEIGMIAGSENYYWLGINNRNWQWLPQAPKQSFSPSYIGCYKDSSIVGTLGGFIENATVASCSELCGRKDYNLMAIQQEWMCLCVNTYHSDGLQVDDDLACPICNENATERCGASNTAAVYALGAAETTPEFLYTNWKAGVEEAAGEPSRELLDTCMLMEKGKSWVAEQCDARRASVYICQHWKSTPSEQVASADIQPEGKYNVLIIAVLSALLAVAVLVILVLIVILVKRRGPDHQHDPMDGGYSMPEAEGIYAMPETPTKEQPVGFFDEEDNIPTVVDNDLYHKRLK